MLALDYLKRLGKASPEVQMKAESFINHGYQTLLNYEVSGGGFDWYGRAPSNIALSAYGLLEFTDMAKVYEIDTRVIDRTQRWLLGKQGKDGAWDVPDRTVYSLRAMKGKMTVTAWVAWSMLESGFRGQEVQNALVYLKEHADEAEGNLYIQALMANVLVCGDKDDGFTMQFLRNLEAAKTVDPKAKTVYWKSTGQTITNSRGVSADIETTALVTYALMKSGRHVNTVNKALAYLVQAKNSRGTWGSTQATILSLKALLKAAAGGEADVAADIDVLLNGKKATTVKVTPETSDVLRLVDLKDLTREGDNELEIRASGETNMMYQIVSRHYRPWKLVGGRPQKVIDIDLQYDRTDLKKDDILTADVTITYNGAQPTFMVLTELGVPPGFTLIPDAFQKMLQQKQIDKYQVTQKGIFLYFGNVDSGQSVKFSYQLQAKYPLRAKTPKSVAYEYYTPSVRDEVEPVELVVRQ